MSKLGIELPAGQAEIERRKDHVLAVARNQRQLRFDKISARLQRNSAFEYAGGSNAQRLSGSLQVQEKRISPGEGILRLRIRHVNLPTRLDSNVSRFIMRRP